MIKSYKVKDIIVGLRSSYITVEKALQQLKDYTECYDCEVEDFYYYLGIPAIDREESFKPRLFVRFIQDPLTFKGHWQRLINAIGFSSYGYDIGKVEEIEDRVVISNKHYKALVPSKRQINFKAACSSLLDLPFFRYVKMGTVLKERQIMEDASSRLNFVRIYPDGILFSQKTDERTVTGLYNPAGQEKNASVVFTTKNLDDVVTKEDIQSLLEMEVSSENFDSCYRELSRQGGLCIEGYDVPSDVAVFEVCQADELVLRRKMQEHS